MLFNEIKDYINLVSRYSVTTEEETLIKDAIKKVEEDNVDYWLLDKDNEVTKYNFNNYNQVEFNIFLQTIKVPKRHIEIFNFSTNVAKGIVNIEDIEIPTNLQIVNICRQKRYTISTCESATSGLVCSTLTNIEGSSEVVEGGFITYTNQQKIRVGISQLIIDKVGVYSSRCAEEMAKVAISNTDSNIGIGVTGTLGNIDTNNKDSQVGNVFISLIIDKEIISLQFELTNEQLQLEREEQKKIVVDFILENLLKFLK